MRERIHFEGLYTYTWTLNVRRGNIGGRRSKKKRREKGKKGKKKKEKGERRRERESVGERERPCERKIL